MDDRKRIMFAGGGTAGPVTPLLAVLDEMKKKWGKVEAHWVGTVDGPERRLIAERGLPFTALRAAKIDRFLSLRNLAAPFLFVASCIRAWDVLGCVRPDVVVAAGAFVAVPVVMMARLRGIPTLIHQLDVRPGLANKLMAPFATAITVTFEKSVGDFAARKTSWTGAPVRETILYPKTNSLPLRSDKPVVLVFGGGTGAQAINEMVTSSVDELTAKLQVVHITGAGKGKPVERPDYHRYEFLSAEMGEAYAKAHVVVTRAGLGTILELAALGKPAIVIPIPNSHQEDNAEVLMEAQAAWVLEQSLLSPQEFAAAVIRLCEDKEEQAKLSAKIGAFYRADAAAKIIEKIEEIGYSTPSNEPLT